MMMKLVLFALCMSFSSSAFAFLCNYNDERVEIPISVLTLQKQKSICPNLAPEAMNLPMVLAVVSPGGFLFDTPEIIGQIKEAVVESKKRTGVTPLAIVAQKCDSACVILLAALNKMAADKEINLVVDTALEIGIHGAYDFKTKKWSEDGTVMYVGQLVRAGVNREWLLAHGPLFEDTEMKPFGVNSTELDHSNILDHAIKKNAIESYKAFPGREF